MSTTGRGRQLESSDFQMGRLGRTGHRATVRCSSAAGPYPAESFPGGAGLVKRRKDKLFPRAQSRRSRFRVARLNKAAAPSTYLKFEIGRGRCDPDASNLFALPDLEIAHLGLQLSTEGNFGRRTSYLTVRLVFRPFTQVRPNDLHRQFRCWAPPEVSSGLLRQLKA
ncbi:hypothetical protein Tco_1399983 [Tanacetum coccineum]